VDTANPTKVKRTRVQKLIKLVTKTKTETKISLCLGPEVKTIRSVASAIKHSPSGVP